MKGWYGVTGIKALVVAAPLWLILVLAAGEITWKLAAIAPILLVVLWIVTLGRAPRKHDIPPSPDEWWNRWG